MHVFLKSTETWATAALATVSLVFFLAARALPEGVFDPLGPGAAPEMVAGLLFVLCAIVLIRAFLRARAGAETPGERPIDVVERANEPTYAQLGYFFVLLLLYILAFQFRVAHFIPVTTVFVTLAILAMHGWALRRAPRALAIGLGLSVTMFYALTQFFVIRLPGAF